MTLTTRLRLLTIAAAMSACTSGAARAETIAVPAGGDLQQAIDKARPGDTLTLAAGAVYTGNFVLPAKDGSLYITIRTAGEGLPRTGQRIVPAYGGRLAIVKSANSEPSIRTAPGAHHWRLQL